MLANQAPSIENVPICRKLRLPGVGRVEMHIHSSSRAVNQSMVNIYPIILLIYGSKHLHGKNKQMKLKGLKSL